MRRCTRCPMKKTSSLETATVDLPPFFSAAGRPRYSHQAPAGAYSARARGDPGGGGHLPPWSAAGRPRSRRGSSRAGPRTPSARAAPSPLPCRRGPPAPAVRLLRRRRGAVALALALRGATRNQSNPLGAASSPTDVAHAPRSG